MGDLYFVASAWCGPAEEEGVEEEVEACQKQVSDQPFVGYFVCRGGDLEKGAAIEFGSASDAPRLRPPSSLTAPV